MILETSGVPIIGAHNKLLGYRGIDRDVTERKRAEEKIKAQLAELLRWQNGILDREDRVQELKNEINALLVQLGQKPRYGGSRYDQGSLQ